MEATLIPSRLAARCTSASQSRHLPHTSRDLRALFVRASRFVVAKLAVWNRLTSQQRQGPTIF